MVVAVEVEVEVCPIVFLVTELIPENNYQVTLQEVDMVALSDF